METIESPIQATKVEENAEGEVAPIEEPEKKEEVAPTTPKRELKKYKGLYTYDPEAVHFLVKLVVNGGADEAKVIRVLDTYNAKSHPLLNLKTKAEATKAFKQMFIVGELPSAEVAISYMMQEVKSLDVKQAFDNKPYRTIVISKENLDVLKSSGNIAIYMELYKRLYLKR
jgi:hypothetical protein